MGNIINNPPATSTEQALDIAVNTDLSEETAPATEASTSAAESFEDRLLNLGSAPGVGFKGDSQYDTGLIEQSDQNTVRAINQSGWDEAGNALSRMTVGAGLEALEMFGYAADIVGNVVTAAAPTAERDFSNALSDSIAKAQETWDQDMFPLYKLNPDKTIDMGDSAWWWENIAGAGQSALGFMGTGFGIGTGLKLVGKGLKHSMFAGAKSAAVRGGKEMSRGLIKAGLVSEKAISNPLVNSLLTSQSIAAMNATEAYKDIYDYGISQIQQGKTDLTEEDVKRLAAENAAGTFNNTWAMSTVLNATSLMPFTRNAGRYTSKMPEGNGISEMLKNIRTTLKDPEKLKAGSQSFNRILNLNAAGRTGLEMLQEGVEEVGENYTKFLGSKAGKEQLGADDIGDFDITSDENKLAFAVGALTGGFISGIGNVYERTTANKPEDIYKQALELQEKAFSNHLGYIEERNELLKSIKDDMTLEEMAEYESKMDNVTDKILSNAIANSLNTGVYDTIVDDVDHQLELIQKGERSSVDLDEGRLRLLKDVLTDVGNFNNKSDNAKLGNHTKQKAITSLVLSKLGKGRAAQETSTYEDLANTLDFEERQHLANKVAAIKFAKSKSTTTEETAHLNKLLEEANEDVKTHNENNPDNKVDPDEDVNSVAYTALGKSYSEEYAAEVHKKRYNRILSPRTRKEELEKIRKEDQTVKKLAAKREEIKTISITIAEELKKPAEERDISVLESAIEDLIKLEEFPDIKGDIGYKTSLQTALKTGIIPRAVVQTMAAKASKQQLEKDEEAKKKNDAAVEAAKKKDKKEKANSEVTVNDNKQVVPKSTEQKVDEEITEDVPQDTTEDTPAQPDDDSLVKQDEDTNEVEQAVKAHTATVDAVEEKNLEEAEIKTKSDPADNVSPVPVSEPSPEPEQVVDEVINNDVRTDEEAANSPAAEESSLINTWVKESAGYSEVAMDDVGNEYVEFNHLVEQLEDGRYTSVPALYIPGLAEDISFKEVFDRTYTTDPNEAVEDSPVYFIRKEREAPNQEIKYYRKKGSENFVPVTDVFATSEDNPLMLKINDPKFQSGQEVVLKAEPGWRYFASSDPDLMAVNMYLPEDLDENNNVKEGAKPIGQLPISNYFKSTSGSLAVRLELVKNPDTVITKRIAYKTPGRENKTSNIHTLSRFTAGNQATTIEGQFEFKHTPDKNNRPVLALRVGDGKFFVIDSNFKDNLPDNFLAQKNALSSIDERELLTFANTAEARTSSSTAGTVYVLSINSNGEYVPVRMIPRKLNGREIDYVLQKLINNALEEFNIETGIPGVENFIASKDVGITENGKYVIDLLSVTNDPNLKNTLLHVHGTGIVIPFTKDGRKLYALVSKDRYLDSTDRTITPLKNLIEGKAATAKIFDAETQQVVNFEGNPIKGNKQIIPVTPEDSVLIRDALVERLQNSYLNVSKNLLNKDLNEDLFIAPDGNEYNNYTDYLMATDALITSVDPNNPFTDSTVVLESLDVIEEDVITDDNKTTTTGAEEFVEAQAETLETISTLEDPTENLSETATVPEPDPEDETALDDDEYSDLTEEELELIKRANEQSSTGSVFDEDMYLKEDTDEDNSNPALRAKISATTVKIDPVEFEWFKETIGDNYLQIIKNVEFVLSNGRKAWGYYKNAMAYVAENSQEGTAYHEAFHLIMEIGQSADQRGKLFDEAAKKSGIARNKENQLEEWLADEFAKYKLDQDKIAKGGVIRKFFNMIKNFIVKILPIKNSLDKMFQHIADGNFTVDPNSSFVSNEPKFRLIKGIYNVTYQNEIIRYVKQLAFDITNDAKSQANKDRDVASSVYTQLTNTKHQERLFTADGSKKYSVLFKLEREKAAVQKEKETLEQTGENPSKVYRLTNKIDLIKKIQQEWSDVRDITIRSFKNEGLRVKLVDSFGNDVPVRGDRPAQSIVEDEFAEEDINNTEEDASDSDRAYGLSPLVVNPKNTMSVMALRLMYNIPKYDLVKDEDGVVSLRNPENPKKVNLFDLETTYDSEVVYRKVNEEMADVPQDKFLSELENKAQTSELMYAFNQTLQRHITSESVTLASVISFFNQSHRQLGQVQKTGGVVTSTNGNQVDKVDKIFSEWAGQSAEVNLYLSTPQGFITNDKQLDKISKGIAALQKEYYQKKFNNRSVETTEQLLETVTQYAELMQKMNKEVLNQMGINVHPLVWKYQIKQQLNLYKNNQTPKLVSTEINKHYNNVVGRLTTIKEHLEKNKDIFSTNRKYIVDTFIKNGQDQFLSDADTVAASYIGQDGKARFTINLPSYYTDVIADINYFTEEERKVFVSDLMANPFYNPTGKPEDRNIFIEYLSDPENIQKFRLVEKESYKDGTLATDYANTTELDSIIYNLAEYHNGDKKGKLNKNIARYNTTTKSDKNRSVFAELPRIQDDTQRDQYLKAGILQEMARVVMVNKNPELKKVKDFNGDRFLIYPYMNSILDNTEISIADLESYLGGKLRATNKKLEIIDSQIEDIVIATKEAVIEDTLDYMESVGLIRRDTDNLIEFSEAWPESSFKTKNIGLNLIRNYAVDSFIWSSQLSNFFSGDPAFFKNETNFFKRGYENVTPGVKAVTSQVGTNVKFARESFSMKILEDTSKENSTEYIQELISLIDPTIKAEDLADIEDLSNTQIQKKFPELVANTIIAYKSIPEITDGQSYISLDFYKELLGGLGKWSYKHDIMYYNYWSEEGLIGTENLTWEEVVYKVAEGDLRWKSKNNILGEFKSFKTDKDKQEFINEKLKIGDTTTLNVLKPFYKHTNSENKFSNKANLHIPLQVKTSTFPITARMAAADGKFKELHDNMKASKVEFIAYASAVKVGQYGVNEDFDLADTHKLETKYLRFPQFVDSKEKADQVVGTQILKMILNNIQEIPGGEDLTIKYSKLLARKRILAEKQLKKDLEIGNEAIGEWTDPEPTDQDIKNYLNSIRPRSVNERKVQELYNAAVEDPTNVSELTDLLKLKIPEGMSFPAWAYDTVVKHKRKALLRNLARIIKSELVELDISQNYEDALRLVEDIEGNSEYVLELDFPVFVQKYEQIINSLFHNRIMKMFMKVSSPVQVAHPDNSLSYFRYRSPDQSEEIATPKEDVSAEFTMLTKEELQEVGDTELVIGDVFKNNLTSSLSASEMMTEVLEEKVKLYDKLVNCLKAS